MCCFSIQGEKNLKPYFNMCTLNVHFNLKNCYNICDSDQN